MIWNFSRFGFGIQRICFKVLGARVSGFWLRGFGFSVVEAWVWVADHICRAMSKELSRDQRFCFKVSRCFSPCFRIYGLVVIRYMPLGLKS